MARNIQNLKTRRAYEFDVADFLAFAGRSVAGLRAVTRAHVIA